MRAWVPLPFLVPALTSDHCLLLCFRCSKTWAWTPRKQTSSWQPPLAHPLALAARHAAPQHRATAARPAAAAAAAPREQRIAARPRLERYHTRTSAACCCPRHPPSSPGWVNLGAGLTLWQGSLYGRGHEAAEVTKRAQDQQGQAAGRELV